MNVNTWLKGQNFLYLQDLQCSQVAFWCGVTEHLLCLVLPALLLMFWQRHLELSADAHVCNIKSQKECTQVLFDLWRVKREG